MSVISVSKLSRRFGAVHAVSDLSLEVPAQSVYAFLGPNGAGKTTTIRLILGLLRPDAGEIRMFGESVRQRRVQVLRRVGAMVESPSLYQNLTGRENLEVKRRILGAPPAEIDRVLEIVGLQKSATRLVRGYSFGMKQRLGVALAMLGGPELLILDEPTNGLDPAGIEEMRTLIGGLPETHGVTVFLSSHLLSEVEQVATHVAILSQGKTLFDGAMEQLQEQQRAVLVIGVDRANEAAQLLSRSGFSSSPYEGKLWLDGGVAVHAGVINTMLVQAGFCVHELVVQRPTLERIFLDMTTEAAC